MNRFRFMFGTLALLLSIVLSACSGSAATPPAATTAPAAPDAPAATTAPAAIPATGGLEIRLDYAYYNPSSLILKHFGWLEEDVKADGTSVKWVLSAGSNKANEFLRSDAIDFGSTAGAAALLAKANGSPIQAVYIFSKPEWTALVVSKTSTVTDITQLKGKKIAATKGTDPYFFLLRSLRKAGLTAVDVEIVNLQHADGKVALERGQVDAWAGLDPFMAQTEIEQGSRLLYRNIDFNSYGFLNARTAFLNDHPEAVAKVLAAYERARRWIQENPDQAAQIVADESKQSLAVVKRVLGERTVLDSGVVPGETQAAVLREIIPIFKAEQQVKDGTDVDAALKDLLAPQYIQKLAQK
ncbi:MAG: aliphatic sulfonate ABC transporter substrate-binding protein [Roseiflexaceae bacterium]|nr:aliphatic sulfonate ABC transporter substrate-binding protein [Roseiflexaceae bacterium]